jgi:DNA repair ATPase RecN
LSGAHANPDDLKRLQRSVTEAQDAIEQALGKLKSALNRADWNDPARRNFEERLNEASASVRQAKDQLGEQLSPLLARKISELATYLGHS